MTAAPVWRAGSDVVTESEVEETSTPIIAKNFMSACRSISFSVELSWQDMSSVFPPRMGVSVVRKLLEWIDPIARDVKVYRYGVC